MFRFSPGFPFPAAFVSAGFVSAALASVASTFVPLAETFDSAAVSAFAAARVLAAERVVDLVAEVVLAVVLPFDEPLELLLLLRVDEEPALFVAALLRGPLDLLGAFSVIYVPR